MIRGLLPILLFINIITFSQTPGKFKITPGSREKVHYFPIQQIKLLDGPLKNIKDKVHNYLLTWNCDSLLHWHRIAAGLQPKAAHYKGWESGSSNILGHYLTAISLMYATTNDKQLLERVNYIVDELADCQAAAKDGAVFNGPNFRKAFNDMRNGKFEYRVVGPEFPIVNDGNFFYGIHKNIAGLRDAYLFADNNKAKQVLIRYTNWIDDLVRAIPEKEFQQVLAVEHGGMSEVIADVYAITGEKKYAQLSRKFVQQRIAQPLAEGRDALFPQHANAKIPQFVGYARIYSLMGDEAKMEGQSSFNFYDIVLRNHTLANGGNSEYERFGPAGQISERIGMSSSETCNTYNMIKLAGELYSLTGHKHYFDYIEGAIYNHLQASVDDNGMFCYYVSMKPGWFKTFSTPHGSNWCCVGSGMENPGKYEERIYSWDSKSLYINLFIPSELVAFGGKLDIKQTGNFPESDTISVTVARNADNLAVKLRRPEWLAGEPEIWVNRKKIVIAAADDYLNLPSKLKAGDVIKVRFPRKLQIKATPDNPNIAALFYGPVLLAANLGDSGIADRKFQDEDAWGLTKYPSFRNVPVIVQDIKNPALWLSKTNDGSLNFVTSAADGKQLQFRPFYSFTKERYSVYLDMFTPEEFEGYQQRRKSAVIDEINIGDTSSENIHHLEANQSKLSSVHFQHYRSIDSLGWITYQMKGGTSEPLFLQVKYWGGGWGIDPKGRVNIFVNDSKIASKDLGDKKNETLFYKEAYEIPSSLLSDGQPMKIRFKAASEKLEGGIFGVQIVSARGLALKELLSDR